MFLTETTVDTTTALKWYEEVANWLDKPGFKAFAIIGLIVVGGLVIYHLGLKKLIRKMVK